MPELGATLKSLLQTSEAEAPGQMAMKSNSKFIIYGFILFAILGVACSTADTSASDNGTETKELPSPTSRSAQNDRAIFVRPEGWKIPLPEKRKQFKTYVRNSMSENGKSVKRTMITYAPVGDFLFQRENAISNSGIELKSESLKLRSIWEVKVNENVYSYTVVARKAMHDKQAGETFDHEHDFTYRYFDMDGDGKFETLVTDDSEILIPSWAAR